MHNASIIRASAPFARSAVVLLGVAVLAFLLIMPNFEGRNMDATLFEVYFNDPFLAYVYAGSIPFFVALYHAFAFFGGFGESANSLRTIRKCALALIGFIAGAEAWIILVVRRTEEDIAGGVAMGILALCVSGAMYAAAFAGERMLRKAVDMQRENGLMA